MVDSNLTTDQPFFELVVPQNRSRRIPSVGKAKDTPYPEDDFYLQRNRFHEQGRRNMLVQDGTASPLIAETNNEEELIVYDSQTYERQYITWPRNSSDHSRHNMLEYDPNTGYLFVGERDYTYIFDPVDEVVVEYFRRPNGRARGIHVADDGGFASSWDNGRVQVYDENYNRILQRDLNSRTKALHYDSENEILYTGSGDRRIRKIDVETNTVLDEGRNKVQNNVETLTISPITGNLVIGGANYLQIFDSDDLSNRLANNTNTSNTVRSLFVHTDPDIDNGDIIAGMSDGTVAKFDNSDLSLVDSITLENRVGTIKQDNNYNAIVGLRDGNPTSLVRVTVDSSSVSEQTPRSSTTRNVSGIAYDSSSGEIYWWDGARSIYRKDPADSFDTEPDPLTFDGDPNSIQDSTYEPTNDNFIVAHDEVMIAYDASTGVKQWKYEARSTNNNSMNSVLFEAGLLFSSGQGVDGDSEIRIHNPADGTVNQRRKWTRQPRTVAIFEDSDGNKEIYLRYRDRGLAKLDGSLQKQWTYRQFNDGDGPSSFAVDSTFLYVGHSDPRGIIKFNKDTGTILDRYNDVRQTFDDIQIGPDNTLIGLRRNDAIRVIDRADFEEICLIEEKIHSGTQDPRYIEFDSTNNKLYVATDDPYAIRRWDIESTQPDRARYQCTILAHDIYINGHRVMNNRDNNVIEDMTLRAGDTVSTSNTDTMHIVGIKRSDN